MKLDEKSFNENEYNSKESTMRYKVHKLKFNMEKHQNKLEEFLNNLEGEVVSRIPNNRRMSLLQIYGASAKINFLYVDEKIK